MSIWADIHRRSTGETIRKEDKEPVYFRIYNLLRHFEPGDEITFNENTDKECIAEFIQYGYWTPALVFKLVKGDMGCVESGVSVPRYDKPFKVEFVEPLSKNI